ncbi:MAG: alpha/beta hydrolase [Pseudomonadota bacterium]
MLRILKWLALLLIVAVVGVGIWAYAPDRDVAELRAEYGEEPSQFIELPNGQTVHVRDTGSRDAPVLLLMHGSGASLHTWEGWAEALEGDYRVIRYDHAGHGLTGPHIANDYSAAGQSDMVHMLMQQLGIESYIVAGNSMGGRIGWHHALDHPDAVRGLILIDSSGAPQPDDATLPIGFRLAQSDVLKPILGVMTPRSIIAETLKGSVAEPDKLTDAQIDRYWHLLRYPGNREAMFNPGTGDPARKRDSEQIANISVPSLILWGAQDTLIPVDSAQWFDEKLPDSTLVIYSDLGHIPMEEDPARTAGDVREWLIAKGLDIMPPSRTPAGIMGGAADTARAAWTGQGAENDTATTEDSAESETP